MASYLLYCTNDRFQQTGEISHFIKALRLRQLRVKLIFSQVSADSFRVNIQECSRSLYAFIAFRPTCFARRLVMRNLQETSTQRARYSEFKDDLIHFSQFFLCLNHVFTGGSLRASVCVSLRDALVANNSKATQAKGEGDRDRDLWSKSNLIGQL